MYAILDFETTGLNYKENAVIEIGVVTTDDNLKLRRTYRTLVKLPEGEQVPDFITNLTGLKDDDLVNAPEAEDVFKRLRMFIGDRIIVAHNASFDLGFLHKYLPDYSPDFIDTRYMSLVIEPRQSASLASCVQRHGIPYENHHSALDDCKMTLGLLQTYAKMVPDLDAYKNKLIDTAERPLSYVPKSATIIVK